MKPIDPKNIERLLIRSTNWIGDAVMTTPAIQAVRHHFSHAHITLLLKPWVAPVFKNSKHVDDLLIYDGNGRHKGVPGKLCLAKDLRKYNFDATILLQNAFEAALITFLAGIPIRIGYNTDARRMLLTHAIPCTREIKKQHQTQYYLNIVGQMGIAVHKRDLYLELGWKDRLRAEQILMKHGVSENDKLVGINPGATFGPAKKWPLMRYARLADQIHALHHARIIIFGGPDDGGLGKEISRIMKYRPVDLSGKTTLGEAMAVMEKCALFVTNDSGLMHVAAALHVPLIAIFGSTNATTTGPLSPNSRVVQVPLECSPCLKPECPKGHLNCMDQISVDRVMDVAKDML